MTQLKKSRLTLLLAGLLLLALPFDAMAIETVRVRPRRIVINQGAGAVALVITRAAPRQPFEFVVFDVQPVPPGVSFFFFPEFLLFPDRGHLFVDAAMNAPVGIHTVRVIGYVYNFDGTFVRTIFTTIIVDIRPAVSPTGPGNGNKLAPRP